MPPRLPAKDIEENFDDEGVQGALRLAKWPVKSQKWAALGPLLIPEKAKDVIQT